MELFWDFVTPALIEKMALDVVSAISMFDDGTRFSHFQVVGHSDSNLWETAPA